MLKHLFGESPLPGDLEREGASRPSGLQDVQGLHLLRVEEHGGIDDAGLFGGHGLDVGIMGGHHTEGLTPVQGIQAGFGDGTPQLRLSAGAELIDQKQGAAVAMLDKIPDAHQMRAVGA